MTPDHWNRIGELFDAALDLEPAERTAYLEQACADNDALYREVCALLEEDRHAHNLLDGVALDAVSLLDELSDEGKQIGPYVLVRQLGAGGMGTVYLAERTDGEFEQQVALKLIKRGMDSEQIVRRFRSERQILARLEHPNIARLLDGGLTEPAPSEAGGQPYFVMEYVDGVPIDDYCDAHRLSIDERLTLFQDVCKAVLYAHRNLVVHRDLKPENILVIPASAGTGLGTVKLLDFGIAKVLTDERDGTALTRTGRPIMTPEYASPEQVRGEPVNTATDIYSLGVVLYELLAGHRPYTITSRNPVEVARVIGSTEPDKPSTAVGRTERGDSESDTTPEAVSRARQTEVGRLRKRLSGDLDTICLKALKKEPERRYGSVEALAEDLRRHLGGLPVWARRDTVGYRLGKFIRRRRVGVALTVAILVLVTALVGFYTARLAQERDRVALEANTASQVVDFLESLFVASNELNLLATQAEKGQDLTARQLLAHGVERVEAELADQPVVQARMMMVLGNSLRSLGEMEEARRLLERAHAIRLAHYGPAHLSVSESLNDLGSIHTDLGEYDQAETYFRQALETLRSLVAPEDVRLGVVANDLGLLLRQKGDYQGAEPLLREALGIFRGHYGNEHPFVAVTITNLGGLLRTMGKADAAEPLLREALALKRRLLGDKDPSVANTMGHLGSLLLHSKNDPDAAEPFYREALAIRREALGAAHPYVAISLNELAGVLHAQGDLEAAERLYREALALRRRVLREHHPHIAYSLVGLARLLMERNQPDAAEPLLREALAIRRRALPEGHELLAETHGLLGACLVALQRFDDAEPLLLASHTALQAKRGGQDPRTREAAQRLVHLYEAWEKPARAAAYDTRSVDTHE